MTRMRTIDQAYEEIKLADPKSPVTKHYIRLLAKQGLVPTRKAGNKYLINYDRLENYLSGDE